MKVLPISITKPIQIEGLTEVEVNSMSAEQLIVYVARVSNPNNQLNLETSSKLLKYLIDNKHWSPFEMVDFTVEITTSRGIAQQILRHRSFSFQEFSQRYAEVTDFEEVQLRKAGATNRQSSLEEFDPYIPIYPAASASVLIKNHLEDSEKLYKKLLEAGVAKECARFILPITTQTKIYMKGSVRSWIHYLQIRTDEHTQLEHRVIALAIQNLFMQYFPNISEALLLKNNG